MDKWVTLTKDMITLAMFILAFYGIIWKALDSWEKRKSAPIKKMDERLEKVERCCDEMNVKMNTSDSKSDQILSIVLSHFKK